MRALNCIAGMAATLLVATPSNGIAYAEVLKCGLNMGGKPIIEPWEISGGTISVPNHNDLAPAPPWVFPIVQNDSTALVGVQKMRGPGPMVLMLIIDKRTSKVAMVNLTANSAYEDRFSGICEKP